MFTALPPLHTLVAFETAARLGSFQQAALVLHLTPSAISHRIRQLEHYLGKPLFERRHRRIILTEAGTGYYKVVHQLLQNLSDGTEQIRERPHKRLRLSVAPALGSHWLMHHLTTYQEAHPEVEFELSTSTGLAPLLAGECDLGLRYGEESWPGLEAWKLFDETLITVCSPEYYKRVSALSPGDFLGQARLLRHPLLSWSAWFAATGLAAVEADGPRYEDALLMLEAAVSGQGLALMTSTLAAPYLARGSLIQPLPFSSPGYAFYIVAPHATQAKPWITAFIRWLIRNTRNTGHTSHGTS